MSRSEKTIQKIISIAVAAFIIVIFLLLAVQLFFFIRKAISDAVAVSLPDKADTSCVSAGPLHVCNDSASAASLAVDAMPQKTVRRKYGTMPVGNSQDSSRSFAGAGKRKNVVSGDSEDGHMSRFGKKYSPIVRRPKPRINLNTADSAALLDLYGIGPYFAGKIINYRERLGGSYASVYQLLEIWGIDSLKLSGFIRRIEIDTSQIIRLDLYSMSEDSLAMHPYIGPFSAKGIVRFRSCVDSSDFSVDALLENGIISQEKARGLKLYCE